MKALLNKYSNFFIVDAITLLIFADQFSKFFFKNENIQIIPNIFEFKYVQNFGSIFGLPLPQILLIALGVLFSIWCLYYLFFKSQNTLEKILIVFAISGAIGNTTDRVYHGFVIDFISVFSFPVFNIADIYLNIAILLYIYIELKKK